MWKMFFLRDFHEYLDGFLLVKKRVYIFLLADKHQVLYNMLSSFSCSCYLRNNRHYCSYIVYRSEVVFLVHWDSLPGQLKSLCYIVHFVSCTLKILSFVKLICSILSILRSIYVDYWQIIEFQEIRDFLVVMSHWRGWLINFRGYNFSAFSLQN